MADLSAWLRSVAGRAGIGGPDDLAALLAREGSPAPLPRVEGWWDGTVEPSHDRKRELINVLNRQIEGADIWAEYRAFLEGADVTPQEGAPEPSLTDMVARGGLPPPLEDDRGG